MNKEKLIEVKKYHNRFYIRLLALGLRIMSRLYSPLMGYKWDKGGRNKYFTPNESGSLCSDLIEWILPFSKDKYILFTGECFAIKGIAEKVLNTSLITTAGLSDSDIIWDFDKPFPKPNSKFNIIFSQWMLEHILNPYGHLIELSKLLHPNGYLAIGASSYLYQLHRCPIHTYNILPDFLEEFAKQNGFKVIKRRYSLGLLTYLLQKE